LKKKLQGGYIALVKNQHTIRMREQNFVEFIDEGDAETNRY